MHYLRRFLFQFVLCIAVIDSISTGYPKTHMSVKSSYKNNLPWFPSLPVDPLSPEGPFGPVDPGAPAGPLRLGPGTPAPLSPLGPLLPFDPLCPVGP